MEAQILKEKCCFLPQESLLYLLPWLWEEGCCVINSLWQRQNGVSFLPWVLKWCQSHNPIEKGRRALQAVKSRAANRSRRTSLSLVLGKQGAQCPGRALLAGTALLAFNVFGLSRLKNMFREIPFVMFFPSHVLKEK